MSLTMPFSMLPVKFLQAKEAIWAECQASVWHANCAMPGLAARNAVAGAAECFGGARYRTWDVLSQEPRPSPGPAPVDDQ